jgi:hypothetical protein
VTGIVAIHVVVELIHHKNFEGVQKSPRELVVSFYLRVAKRCLDFCETLLTHLTRSFYYSAPALRVERCNMKISPSFKALILFVVFAMGKAAISRACRETAKLARLASQLDAKADFANAKAKGNLLEEQESRLEALSDAKAELADAMMQIEQTFDSRLDLCRELGETRYEPDIEPDEFLSPTQACKYNRFLGSAIAAYLAYLNLTFAFSHIAKNPNPYFPLTQGRVYFYESRTEDGKLEEIAFNVTRETRKILGVVCTEIRDTVTIDGEIHEDTRDWYAQTKDGSVWYFGEAVLNYENDKVANLDGSWEAGFDGAQPGLIMKAPSDFNVGDIYREEYDVNNAEDFAMIVSVATEVTVPAGTFTCLETENRNAIDPDAVERKYWAPGFGSVLEENQSTGERTELVNVVDEN